MIKRERMQDVSHLLFFFFYKIVDTGKMSFVD